MISSGSFLVAAVFAAYCAISNCCWRRRRIRSTAGGRGCGALSPLAGRGSPTERVAALCVKFSGTSFSSERPTRRSPLGCFLPPFGHRDQAFALGLLPGGLPRAPDGFRLLPGLALRRFFIGLATLHLAKNALALHLLFQHPEGLIDIVVANEYLQMFSNRGAGALTGAVEMLGNLSPQRTLRLSADSLPRLLTISNSTV